MFLLKGPFARQKNICTRYSCIGYLLRLAIDGKELGGNVKKCDREYGRSELRIQKAGKLFKGLPKKLTVWNSHGDAIVKMPHGFQADCIHRKFTEFSAIEDTSRMFYGLQFHPEVEHSQLGVEVIKNFLFTICKCKADWDMGDFIEAAVKQIRDQVGNKKVILGLSGGVDSSVACLDRSCNW